MHISTESSLDTNGRRGIVFWSELPKSAYGKVPKRMIRDLW